VPQTKSPTAQLAATDNLGFLLAKAAQRFNELLAERFADRGFGGVRPSYGSVLVPLFDEDDLRLQDLAARSRLAKQTMTALVRHCESDGLVLRRRDPEDRRAFRVSLSERGRAFQRVAEEVLGELDRELEQALGGRKRDALTDALKGIVEL